MSIKSSIILRPILSEKGTMLGEALNKYVFQVEKKCNKLEIKEDIEDTRKFLKTTYANWFGIFCANPLVGSEMFDICVENDYLKDNWIGSDYKQAVVSTEHWSSDYIQQKAYELNLELNLVFNSDYRLGNYELALDGFERVLRAKKDHAIAYSMASKCLYYLNKKEKAKNYQMKSQKIYTSDKYWMNYMKQFNLDPFASFEPISTKF